MQCECGAWVPYRAYNEHKCDDVPDDEAWQPTASADSRRSELADHFADVIAEAAKLGIGVKIMGIEYTKKRED